MTNCQQKEEKTEYEGKLFKSGRLKVFHAEMQDNFETLVSMTVEGT